MERKNVNDTTNEESLARFFEACNKELRRKSFDDYLNEESYRVAKEIENAGRGKICAHCICNLKGKCAHSLKVRVEKRLCWKAKNRKLLKEQGLYGVQRKVKRGID